MPTISTEVFPIIAAVRVQVNWSDVTNATHATVWRVDCITGERVQLRAYVAYNADGYLLLSCGLATFWDTEPALDRCIYYCTTAQDASGTEIPAPTSLIFEDTFERSVADDWGQATPTGQDYTITAGTVTNFDVNGTQGTISHNAVNVLQTVAANVGTPDQDIVLRFTVPVIPTGNTINYRILGRFTDNGNNYIATADMLTTSIMRLNLDKRVGGTLTGLVSLANVGTISVGEMWDLRLQVWGSQIRAKLWEAASPEPDWQITTTDTSLTAGDSIAFSGRLETGNTNALPVVLLYEYASMVGPCPTSETLETCSETMIVSSGGDNWLRDPLHPCNDIRVSLCYTPDPNCVPGRGVFFARMESESYASRTTNLEPVNAKYPIPAARQRSGAESSLVLVTRTFEDRDALLLALGAGTPLLWQSPPEYGFPDRYMSVGTATITRFQPDHRYEPRVATLPFVEVARPDGPSEGICGARVDDLCDIYATWDAMIAAGLSFQDLIDGMASGSGPGLTQREWIDVETEFASWLLVETEPNTWETLRDNP